LKNYVFADVAFHFRSGVQETDAMSKNKMPGVDSRSERENFGQNFRIARAKKGLSQRDVHRLTGVAQSHISEIESGTSNISIDTMVKLATVVNQPLWKLFRAPPNASKS
jgi:DNA-binding XRE family transcriptional regulator